MHLDKEAQRIQEETLEHARPIKDVKTLRRILQESLAVFEKALANLSSVDREEALALYLDKVRRVTFGFHLAVVKQNAQEEFENPLNSQLRQNILTDLAEEMQNLGYVYRFI